MNPKLLINHLIAFASGVWLVRSEEILFRALAMVTFLITLIIIMSAVDEDVKKETKDDREPTPK